MYLSLAIAHSNGYAIDGSPLKLLIRKRCIAFGERRRRRRRRRRHRRR